MARLSKKVIVSGRELIKGAMVSTNLNNNLLYDSMPWQMVDLEDKTEEWKQWVADYFEWVGLRQVYQKQKKTIKNRRMASGILDMEDYVSNGDSDYNYLNKYVIEDDVINDPLKKFYPIIPPFIKVLDGEFLKRNLKVYVTCTDRQTQDDKLEYKMNQVNDIILRDGLKKKQEALQKLGLVETSDEELQQLDPQAQQQAQQNNEQYKTEMSTQEELVMSQQKYKKYRHIFEEFGQLVINKDYERFHMAELEREAFIETLCNSEEAWHIDMMEDDYKIEFLDNACTFHHTSRDLKYYSSGDYFGWFTDVTVGDIINKIGRRLSTNDYDRLQDSVKNLSNNGMSSGLGLLTDSEKGFPSAYYDASKPYPESRTNVPMEQFRQNEVLKALTNPTNNFQNSSDIQNLYANQNRLSLDQPKMFRMMRLYFRSQRKLGWLTKKDRAGIVEHEGWIDENFKINVDPIYDNSLVTTNTAENLIYGEHVEWEWGNEWRHTIKVSANFSHPFWKNNGLNSFLPIYIDGNRIKYHFAGNRDNPFDVLPPFEGIEYKMKGVRPVPFVEQLAPFQVINNIAMNRVPDIMFDDIGLALAVNKLSITSNRPGVEAAGDPIQDFMENLKMNKVADINIDRELIREQGNAAPIFPQVLNLSRIEEGIKYLEVASRVVEMAGDVVGISRQRRAQAKASETATQTQAGINYSETQTEPLFHQHIVDFMPRVYQRMIEAAHYYCTKSESARAFYQTSSEGNAMLEVENLDGTFRTYSVKCTSDIKEAEIKDKLEQMLMKNNTTDTSMYDLALGVVDSSPAEILENLRMAKVEREKQQQEAYKREQDAQKQAEDAALAKQREQQDFISKENQLNRESAELIATTRALGGLQSDNNKDGELDAYQNLQNQMKQMQINLNQQNTQSKLNFDVKKHNDEMGFKDKQLLAKNSIEQKKLAIALVNQNAKDDKALNRRVAKTQGVT